MGQFLSQEGIKADLLLSSPAKRALKTAKKIAKELGYEPKFADRLDLLRDAFAGHDEYPVEAAMSAVADAHDRHVTAAFSGPAPIP